MKYTQSQIVHFPLDYIPRNDCILGVFWLNNGPHSRFYVHVFGFGHLPRNDCIQGTFCRILGLIRTHPY